MSNTPSDQIWKAVHHYMSMQRKPVEQDHVVIIVSSKIHSDLITEFVANESVWLDDMRHHPDHPDSKRLFGCKLIVGHHLPEEKFYITQGFSYQIQNQPSDGN